MWIAGGANWFFGRPPEHWNPWWQLIDGGLGMFVPEQLRAPSIDSRLVANTIDYRLVANANVAPKIITNLADNFQVLAAA
jgi:hypothetical protein